MTVETLADIRPDLRAGDSGTLHIEGGESVDVREFQTIEGGQLRVITEGGRERYIDVQRVEGVEKGKSTDENSLFATGESVSKEIQKYDISWVRSEAVRRDIERALDEGRVTTAAEMIQDYMMYDATGRHDYESLMEQAAMAPSESPEGIAEDFVRDVLQLDARSKLGQELVELFVPDVREEQYQVQQREDEPMGMESMGGYRRSDDVEKVGSPDDEIDDAIRSVKDLKRRLSSLPDGEVANAVEIVCEQLETELENYQRGGQEAVYIPRLESKLSELEVLEILGRPGEQAFLDTEAFLVALKESTGKSDGSSFFETDDDVEKFAANSVPELKDFIIQPMEESFREDSLSIEEIRQAHQEAGDEFFRMFRSEDSSEFFATGDDVAKQTSIRHADKLETLKQDVRREVGHKSRLTGQIDELIRLRDRIEGGMLTPEEEKNELNQFYQTVGTLTNTLSREGAPQEIVDYFEEMATDVFTMEGVSIKSDSEKAEANTNSLFATGSDAGKASPSLSENDKVTGPQGETWIVTGVDGSTYTVRMLGSNGNTRTVTEEELNYGDGGWRAM